jgi:hypothetical protein
MLKKIALMTALCSAASLLVAGCVAPEAGTQENEEVSEGASSLSTTVPAVKIDKTRFVIAYIKAGLTTFEPDIPFYPGSPLVTFNIPCSFEEIAFGATVRYNDTGPTLYVKETFTVTDSSNATILTHGALVTSVAANQEAGFGQPMFFGATGSYATTLVPTDDLLRVRVLIETFTDSALTTASGSPSETTDFWMRRVCTCNN